MIHSKHHRVSWQKTNCKICLMSSTGRRVFLKTCIVLRHVYTQDMSDVTQVMSLCKTDDMACVFFFFKTCLPTGDRRCVLQNGSVLHGDMSSCEISCIKTYCPLRTRQDGSVSNYSILFFFCSC